MVKPTKRKGFNFFRSYYDVYNELNDVDKVAFMDALLERQFQGTKPKGLKGMSNFAYISQTNSIDSQVKGYEDKTGIKLTPCLPPTDGGSSTPTLQVEEKGEVQVKVIVKDINKRKSEFKNSLLDFLSNYSTDMLNDFYEYWSEHGEKDKKMRFEKQKSFSIKARLTRWEKNQKNWAKKETKTDAASLILKEYGLK